MEVVVAFTEGGEGSDDMVARRVAVIEWLVTKPVSQRVDAECGLLDEKDAKDAGIDESAKVVSPSQTCDKGREDKTHEQNDLEVVSMLPHDHKVLVEVRNICSTDSLGVLLHDHPPKVRIQESLTHGVWVFVCVRVPMLCANQQAARFCLIVICSRVHGDPGPTIGLNLQRHHHHTTPKRFGGGWSPNMRYEPRVGDSLVTCQQVYTSH